MPTPKSATIWAQRLDDTAPIALRATTPLSLTAAGVVPLAWDAEPATDAVWLAPTATRRGPAAALMVPDSLANQVSHDGLRLGAGLYVVRHGQRIDFAGAKVWVSTHGKPQTGDYDPAIHRPDRFCSRTKARLETGEPVVGCAGKPGVPCDELYREAAWRPDTPCAHCGADPRAPAWQPPPPPSKGTIDALRKLARR